MKALFATLCLLFGIMQIKAQVASINSGAFSLYNGERRIGSETFRSYNEAVWAKDDVRRYEISNEFKSEQNSEPLKTTIKILAKSYFPLALVIKGENFNCSFVNDSIAILDDGVIMKINGKLISEHRDVNNTFPLTSYSPAIVRELLIQYWKCKNRPKVMKALPSGFVRIKKIGNDQLKFKGRLATFVRYIVTGMSWGNEVVWTDQQGNLVCISAINVTGVNVTAIRENYESFLPELSKIKVFSLKL